LAFLSIRSTTFVIELFIGVSFASAMNQKSNKQAKREEGRNAAATLRNLVTMPATGWLCFWITTNINNKETNKLTRRANLEIHLPVLSFNFMVLSIWVIELCSSFAFLVTTINMDLHL